MKPWLHALLTLLFLTIGHNGISFGLDTKSGQPGAIVSTPEYGITGLNTSAVVDVASSWQYTVQLTQALEHKRRRTNAAMQRSAAQASVSGNTLSADTTPPDTTPPDTTITSNPPNPTNSTSASFTFTGTDNVTSSLTFEIKLDDGSFTPGPSPKTYFGLSDGPHTFQVRAVDEAGNKDPTPATYTWTVDTIPPDTSLLTYPSAQSNSSTATFTFSSNDVMASYQVKLDDGSFIAGTTPKSYTGLSEGQHTFQVQAVDKAGNIDPTPATYTWVINSLPAITGYTPVSVCTGAPVTLTAAIGNVSGTYAYTLTAGANPVSGTATGTIFSQTLPDLSPGNYSYTLTVSGNGQPASALTDVTVVSLPSPGSLAAGSLPGIGACSVNVTGSGFGNSFVLTGPGGYVYSAVYRQAGTYTFTMPDVTLPGTYTLTIRNGICSATAQTVVSGTACK